MLKKIASDALGLSDIGKIIDPKDFDKAESDDFVRHEYNEKIYFLIMTKSDEYCFTNIALIHIDGKNAVSSKRTMKRYPYYQYRISDVLFETAGKIDLDCEIAFRLGNTPIKIDISKKEMEKVKDLYKSLLHISEEVHENNIFLNMASESLDNAVKVLQESRSTEHSMSDEYEEITKFSFEWLTSKHEEYIKKDFGHIFEKYINN